MTDVEGSVRARAMTWASVVCAFCQVGRVEEFWHVKGKHAIGSVSQKVLCNWMASNVQADADNSLYKQQCTWLGRLCQRLCLIPCKTHMDRDAIF